MCSSDLAPAPAPSGQPALTDRCLRPSRHATRSAASGRAPGSAAAATTRQIAAIRAGATRVHGCAIGIGERVGNTPMDQLLVNLQLMGWIDHDLTALTDYCRKTSEGTGVPIPVNYPVVGDDAFRTGTGVHAAAVIKAFRKGDRWLADRVYSGVPAEMVGRHQEIEVGPMSGESNVVFWLEKIGRAHV